MSETGVRISIRGVGKLWPHNPWPVAFVRVNGELIDFYPCGTVHRRVKWLPLWIPFNSRYSYSPSSQAACVRMLREKYTKLLEAMKD